jgi:hypothetical protein
VGDVSWSPAPHPLRPTSRTQRLSGEEVHIPEARYITEASSISPQMRSAMDACNAPLTSRRRSWAGDRSARRGERRAAVGVASTSRVWGRGLH